MRAIALFAIVSLVACGHDARGPVMLTPPPPPIEAPITFDGHAVPLGELLAKQPLSMVVDLRELRTPAGGAALVRALAYGPIPIEIATASGVDAFSDGDWFVWVGKKMVREESSLLVHHRSEARGGAATLWGRVIVRPHARAFAAVPRTGDGDLATTFATFTSEEPASELGAHELGRMRIADGSLVHPILGEVSSIVVRGRGAGDGFALAATGETAACAKVVAELRGYVDANNGTMIRAALHGLLDGIKLECDGNRVVGTLPISNEQLLALASIAGAYYGAPISP